MEVKSTVLSAIAVIALMSGCGSDSDSDSEFEQLKPTVAYTQEVTDSHNGKTYTAKAGANGDFQAIKNEEEVTAGFIDGVETPYLVTTLTSEYSFDTKYSSDHFKGISTSDFTAGTEHLKGTSDVHGSFDCINSYESPLPKSFYYAEELEDPYFDESTRNNTTCPDWMDEEIEEDPSLSTVTTNVIVNDISYISTYRSLK